MKNLIEFVERYWISFGYILILTFFVLAFLSRGIFVGQDTAYRALETAGYTSVRIIGNDWFLVGLHGCDLRDAAKFDVEATNPAGKKVELYVCSGWPFKGAITMTK